MRRHYSRKRAVRAAGLWRLRTVILLLAPLLLAACQSVSERTLANGLRVIVKRDTRAPVVVSQLWYRVGSVDEPPQWTGISHALEHMMFKGTTKYPAGKFFQLISENGGQANAFTAQDETVFYEEIEKSRLPLVLSLEADRMQHLLVPDQEYRKERQVIMEERRMRTDDQPDAVLDEHFQRAAFRVSPYGVPVIGWMSNIRRLTPADIRTWYHEWYAPNNAILVVVGDVHPETVFRLAQKDFGAIPSRPLPARHIPSEPPQHHLRTVSVSVPAQVPELVMGFHVPVITANLDDWRPFALDVLAGVLSGGASGRLPTDLVRHQQIAAAVDAEYNDTARYPDLFTISATPAAGHSMVDLEEAILTEISGLQHGLISRDELKRVQQEVVAADVYQRDSMSAQAMLLGNLALLRLPLRLMDDYVSRIRAVTPQQVQAVARDYFSVSQMTVGMLHPLPMHPSRAAPARSLDQDGIR